MVDLFSSMDGMQSFFSWGIPIMFLFLIISNSNWMNFSLIYINSTLNSLWGTGTYKPMKFFLLTSLMYFLILNNLIGLTPFSFGVTSNLWFNSSMAIIMWFCLLFSGWTFSLKKSIAHLTPSGSPMMLTPFLILIESVSIIIRPLTLTVRLMANISAGHIVLSLVANLLSSMNFFPQVMMLILMVGYMLFELFVAFIQAYIFTLLISLYATEHPSLYSLLKTFNC